ncbi:MAG TPA: hypothetical protein VNM67_12670 [Thermoanaerobaculia bacterium]|nr:hypothetical protein [Thermoanaerobaculia bacterium]
MSVWFSRPQGIVFLLLTCFFVAAAGTAHAQTLQSGGLVLHGSRLEISGGRPVPVVLPQRSEVSALAELGRGWITAGSAAGEDGRRTLFLIGNEGALPAPPGQQGAERRGPVFFVENGTLQGMAWLEGSDDRTLAVRAAEWNGHAWQAVEPVSQPGPGSQIALAGAVLSDGSWLLAWSAYDGEDHEIVWARRTAQGWSPARPVSKGNAVPDITPALTAAGTGALLAWSRYDGESYRLQIARFESNSWKDERPVAPSGSFHPSFQGSYLLYQTAAPRSWSVAELAPSGKVLRRASALSALMERPVLSENAEGGLRLRWIAGEWEAAPALERVP